MEETERRRIVEKIQETLKKRGVMPSNILYIAVSGSRAKGLGSANSDYDTKVITMSSKPTYMLQKVKPSFHFKTHLEREEGYGDEAAPLELEGVAIDILTVTKYVVTQNMSAYDAFGSICLYTTPLADELRRFYMMAYVPMALQQSLKGMLSAFLKKQIGPTATVTTNKKAAEVVYMALKVNYIASAERVPPPFDARELTKASLMSEEDQSFAIDIFRRRKENKEGEFEITDGFRAFAEHALGSDRPVRYKPDVDAIEEAINHKFLDEFEQPRH